MARFAAGFLVSGSEGAIEPMEEFGASVGSDNLTKPGLLRRLILAGKDFYYVTLFEALI